MTYKVGSGRPKKPSQIQQTPAQIIAKEVAHLIAPQVQPKEWITETEALEMLGGISNKTLYKISTGGKITYSPITGRKRLYSRRSILRYIENKAVQSFKY